MSFIPFTEKNKKTKLEFVRNLVGSGFVFPEANPRIRIHIKMKQIQNTEISKNFTLIAFCWEMIIKFSLSKSLSLLLLPKNKLLPSITNVQPALVR